MQRRLLNILKNMFQPARLVFALVFSLVTSLLVLTFTHGILLDEFARDFNLGADNLYFAAMTGIVLGSFIPGMIYYRRLVEQKYYQVLLTGFRIYVSVMLVCWLTATAYTVSGLYNSEQLQSMGSVFYYVFLTPFASGLAMIGAVILLFNWYVLLLYLGSTILTRLALDFWFRTRPGESQAV